MALGATHEGWRYKAATHTHIFNGLLGLILQRRLFSRMQCLEPLALRESLETQYEQHVNVRAEGNPYLARQVPQNCENSGKSAVSERSVLQTAELLGIMNIALGSGRDGFRNTTAGESVIRDCPIVLPYHRCLSIV